MEAVRASAADSICLRVVSSVAHQRLALGPSSGYHLRGRPPMILWSSRAVLISVASWPRSRTNSWKRGAPLKRARTGVGSFAVASTRAVEGELCLGEVLLGELAQALFAVDGEEDGDHQGDERLVGADVGGRLFAADVLLAGGEGEDEAALAVRCPWFRRRGGRASGGGTFPCRR